MPDQIPVQAPQQSTAPQSAPITQADLGVNSGLIDNRPIQAPLPPTNIPDFNTGNPFGAGSGEGGTPKTIAQLFNSMKTPSDEKHYLDPEYTPQPLTKRYENWNPYIDNEEVAANKQPWYDKWANAFVKTGAIAVGTFAQGLMTIPDTMNAIKSGNFSSEYQSDFENGVDNWLKNLEDEFPNYYSKWEQAHPFLSALPFSGGGANFWSDKVLKNLGFTIGAIGSAVAQDTVIGAVTEGIGEIPLVGQQLGKAALWFNKIFSNETKLGEALGATQPGLLSTIMDTAKAVPASKQAMFDLPKLAQMAALKKVTDAGRYAINIYGAARTEAGVEARDGFNTVKQDLVDQFKLQNQRDPIGEEVSDIEKYATAGANVRFGANMALLTLSDAIQFDNILKPFSAARKGITGSLQKALETEGAEIGLKEGTIDTFERKVPKTNSGKIWNAIKPQIPNILSEGVYEEGGQYAAQVATQNYYERKYYAEKGKDQLGTDKESWSPSDIVNIMHSTAQGLGGEFGTTEGWENILLGSLTAILTGGFEHWYDKIKGTSEKSTDATLSLLNNNSVVGLLQNMYGNTTKSVGHAQAMQDAVKKNDLFSFKNEQSQLFTNFILSHLQGNRFDVAMEKLDIAKDLPQGEFEKAFGIDNSTGNKQTVTQYIDALKERAAQIKNNYDAINQVFENPYTFNRKAKDENGLIQNDKHTKFEEWKYTLLQHNSDIDDSNRRRVQIAERVQAIDPSINRTLVEQLTHPKYLTSLGKNYSKQANELQKSIDDKMVLPEDRKETETKINALKDRSAAIEEYLKNPDDDKYLALFDNLLHFEVNLNEVNPENPIEIKKQLLPQLIKDGVDSNRLQARKEIARKAYDVLTAEKGFNRWFNALDKREGVSASIADNTPLAPVDVDTDNLKIPVKTADGKTMTFKEGEDYTLNFGTKENPNVQTVKSQGVDNQGNLQFANQQGANLTVAPTQVNSIEDEQKADDEAFKKQMTSIGTGSPINSTEVPQEEDKKKDLAKGPISTTDPRFEDKAPFDNFHQRHQTFLFNLGSTDSRRFNQAIKGDIRILPVTAATVEQLGLPKELTESQAGQEPVIRAVYVTSDNGEIWFLDEKGHQRQKMGEKVDPSKIIFTTFPDTSLQYQGQDRYTNKQNLDPAKVQEWHKAFRQNLLSKSLSQMPIFNFNVSRGIPNIINQDARNSVVEVGLISKEDLSKAVITIPTQGDVAIAPLLNDAGEGISADSTGVKMPLGVPLLNHGGNLIYLNNRKLTDKEAFNAYDLIKELAKRARENKIKGEDILDQTILKYLSRILYFSTPQDGKTATDQQIWLDKAGLHLGPNFTLPFFVNNIEANEANIKKYLNDYYHNVNNYELSRVNKERVEDLKFNELAMVNGKLTSIETYPTYSHYLLDSKNPPLATNIAKPIGNEIPLKQKYSVLQVNNFNVKALESDKPQVKTSIPAVPGAVKAAKSTSKKMEPLQPKKRITSMRHGKTDDDVKGLTSANTNIPLNAKGIAEVTKFAEDLIDEGGASYIYSSNAVRAVQSSIIVANILGIEADTTSDISNALRSWEIGEFDGMPDAEFEKAERYFIEHPKEMEYEGKKLKESFLDFVNRTIGARLKIEEIGEDGSLVITHSKNLKVWDAFQKNGNKFDKKASEIYLNNEPPANGDITNDSKKELADNEVETTVKFPDGRIVRYAQIQDNEGNVTNIRILNGIVNGKDTQIPDDVKARLKTLIGQSLGLVAETPAITTTSIQKKTEPKNAQTEQIVKDIYNSQKHVQGKTEDEKFYIIDGEQYKRVTSVIPNDFDGDSSKYQDARTAGSTVDKIVRQFFSGESFNDYPEGISKAAFGKIIDALKEIRKNIEDTGETFLTNNIVLFDRVNKIAGEVDILSIDKEGNFHIYDVKTAKDFSKYDESYMGKLTKRENHTNQLSAYSNLFTNEFGVTPKKLGVLPFQIAYDKDGNITSVEKQKGIAITYNPEISEIIPLTATQTPKKGGLGGRTNKPTDTQYRASNIIPGSYKVGNIEQEFEEAKEWLPDYVQFKMMKNLIHMTGGGKAWGAMRDAAIYVYKNAEIGTTYHEAFELVWQNFLDGNKQLALYNEFKEREGLFTTYTGEKKAFTQANFKEAKEQIAEDFRDYVLNKGKVNLPAKQKNWFARLVDFIKKIFLGNTQDINGLFKNITEGYYRNYPASQKNINSIEYRNIKASEAFIQDVLQGMTADLFAREFEKDSAIVTQLEENPKQAVATVYGRLFNSMQHYFTDDSMDATDTLKAIYDVKYDESESQDEKDQIEQEFEGVRNHWEFIKSNWNEFVNEHMQYLRVFKVEFSVDDNGEIKMDSTSRRELENYEQMTGQSEYARDIMTINARNAASEKVKLLFATIADREFIRRITGDTLQTLGQSAEQKTRVKRENSQVRMPKLASYAKTFNYVLHNVTNINGIYDIYKKLVAMSNNTRIKSNAVIDALVNRLNFKNGFKSKSIDQAKLLLSVENTLNKQKPDFVRQFVDDNGNIYFKTSIINSRVDQAVDDWITAMKSGDAVKVTKDSNFIFDKNIKDIKGSVNLLNAIGIPVDSIDYNNLNAADKTKFDGEVNTLRSVLEQNIGKKLPIFTTKQLGIDSRLINLAAIYVDKMVGDDTDSMHFNLDGELTSNFVLPNFASTIQADANNSKTREEFIAKNPHFNDIFHNDSILLNEILFDRETGKFIAPVNIAVVEGRESADTDNRSASSLTEAERYIYEINNNLQGIFYTLLPADAKTEWAIYTGQYIKASEYFDEITGENATAKFYNRMWSNLKTEIALAQDFKTNTNRQNISELNVTPKGETRKKGDSLRFFADLLPTNRVEDIHKRVVDGNEVLEDVIHPEDFQALMQSWVADKAAKSFKYLNDNKIFGISNQGNLKLNGILTDFLGKHIGAKRQYYTEAEALKLLMFREMNYVINNIEMHKFFFGDPAQYSDEMKRIKSFLSGREWSHVDYLGTAEGFNQWANGTLNKVASVPLEVGDPGYHIFSNELNTLTVYDIKVESSSLEMLKKELGKDAKPYEGMNEADAQTWHIGTSYRETLLKAGGRWTQQMDDQFQYEMAYERNTKDKAGIYDYSSESLRSADKKVLERGSDSEAFFYITKPIHSGIQSKGDTAIVSLDKTSSAPLFYRMVQGTALEDVYNAMQKNNVHYIRVESAHKVGIQIDSTIPLYKEDGSINKEGFDKATIEAIPFKYYGIQVDTSSRKESQTEGSQLRKQAVGDLLDDGVPVDFVEGAKSNKKTAKQAWDKLTEGDKRTVSPVYDLVQQHEEDLTALSNKRYFNLLNKLGVNEVEDGFEYKDVKKVSDFLLNEITRRELPNNLRDSIEPDPENPKQFKIPLEALANYQQVRAILWSTIEKNIIRPKVSGGMKTQLAATGWEKNHRIVKTIINGKPVLSSSELKFYAKGEDGKTAKCEVYLPYWFGRKVRQSLEKNGHEFKSDKEFRDHILNYLNNNEEGKKLLSGIGFRIPTQRDNSIESFIVKDFLPEQMGDTIVLPSEVTAKAGSDFDIDKMNTYLRNFFVNYEGYPQAIPFEKIDSNDTQALTDYYKKYMQDARRDYEKWQREAGSNNLVNKIFQVQEEDKEPEYVPSLEEYLDQSKGKSAYELNSLEALENKYFDTLEQIYALPEKFKGLISPNDASDLKRISQKIAKMRDPNYNETKLPYGRVLDSLWMMQERHKYLVGKKGVGMAAVSQTNLNVNQNAQVYLKVPRNVGIRLPHNTVQVGDKSYVSLGSIRNQSGQNISAVNAAFIDGYVDIAKGAWIIDMGATDALASNFLLMTKWGTDPYDVALFMNQPAIRLYTNERATRKSVGQINKDLRQMNSAELYKYVSSQIKPGQGKVALRKIKPAEYSREQMETMIGKVGRGEKLTQPEAKLQMQMLDDYQEYDKLSWDMFRFFQGYNWDTARINDPNLTRRKIISEEKAKDGPISSIDRVMKGFIGTVRDNALKVDGALRGLFSVQTGKAGQVLDATARDFAERKGVTQEEYRKSMLKAELSMMDYIMQTGTTANGRTMNQLIDQILLSNFSAARYLKAIQDSGDVQLVNNPIIKNLRANIDKREGYPSSIELIEKDNDAYTSNIWTDALRELADSQVIISLDNNKANDRSVGQIYRMIVLASVLQSGTKRSSISFTHLLPNEHYAALVKDSVKDIKANMDNFYDNNILYRTNWEDNIIVPIVTPIYQDDFFNGEVISRKTYPGFNSEIFNQHLKDQGITAIPKVLRLDAFTWKDKKVIKSVEYKRDPKTKQIIDRTIRLFQRVDTWETDKGSTPLIASRRELQEGDFQERNVSYAVFKEINKWGDGNKVQEYYDNQIDSKLKTNPLVTELNEDLVTFAIMNSGYNVNTDDIMLGDIAQKFENQDIVQGGEIDTEPDNGENNGTPPNDEEDDVLGDKDNGCKK